MARGYPSAIFTATPRPSASPTAYTDSAPSLAISPSASRTRWLTSRRRIVERERPAGRMAAVTRASAVPAGAVAMRPERGQAGQRVGVKGRAAAVDGHGDHRFLGELDEGVGDGPLEGVLGVPVGGGVPPVDDAGREHGRVLARAVLRDGRLGAGRRGSRRPARRRRSGSPGCSAGPPRSARLPRGCGRPPPGGTARRSGWRRPAPARRPAGRDRPGPWRRPGSACWPSGRRPRRPGRPAPTRRTRRARSRRPCRDGRSRRSRRGRRARRSAPR